MIVTTIHQKNFLGNTGVFKDTQYFGNSVYDSELPLSVKDDFKKYQGCTCVTSEGIEGIIIGFEDSESFNDFYWIIYGSDSKLHYELHNSAGFYKNLK